jgi:hypothetical protein
VSSKAVKAVTEPYRPMADRASSVLAALGSQRMSTQRLERPPGTRPRTALEERSAI